MGKTLVLVLFSLFVGLNPVFAQWSGFAFGGINTSVRAGYENPGIQIGVSGEHRWNDFSIEGTLRQRWQNKKGDEEGNGVSQSAHLGVFYTNKLRVGVGTYHDSYTTSSWEKVGYAEVFDVGYGVHDSDGHFFATFRTSGWNNTSPFETKVPNSVHIEVVSSKTKFGVHGFVFNLGELEFRDSFLENALFSDFSFIFFSK